VVVGEREGRRTNKADPTIESKCKKPKRRKGGGVEIAWQERTSSLQGKNSNWRDAFGIEGRAGLGKSRRKAEGKGGK